MIALDTNVLVRFLVEDDPTETHRAKALLQRAIKEDHPCFVSDVVLCEIVWVLQTRYRVRRTEIIGTLRAVVRSRHLKFSSLDRVTCALDAYGSGRGDFADYLIREQAQTAGCRAVATFDKELLKEPGFIAP